MPRLWGWLGYIEQSPFLAYFLSGALKSTAIGTILLLQFRRVFPAEKVVAPISQLTSSSARALEGEGIDA